MGREEAVIRPSLPTQPAIIMETQRHLFMSLTLLLVGFGLLMVHSASVTSLPT